MFRSRLEVDSQPVDDALAFVEGFDDVFESLVVESYEAVEPAFLDELRYEPGPSLNALNSGSPFRWSDDPEADERGRKGYFARFPNGRARTGALSDSWTVRLQRVGAAFQLLVQTPLRYAKWVVGSFDQRRDWQIPGHRRTGWIPVRDTVRFFFDAFADEFQKRFDRTIPTEWARPRTRRRNR